MNQEEITNWINAAPTWADRQERKMMMLALRYSATKETIARITSPALIEIAELEIQLSKLIEENEERLSRAFEENIIGLLVYNYFCPVQFVCRCMQYVSIVTSGAPLQSLEICCFRN